jgi:diadenylate cyclase
MTAFLEALESLQFSWRDAVDIVIVAFLLYTVLHLIRGTKAMQMSVGILVLAGAYYLARWMELIATERIFAEVLFYLPFAVIILFQQEIRQALAAFGRRPLLRFMAPAETSRIDHVVEATRMLASRSWGALIVVERTESLRAWTETGKRIDAALSAELLVNIFAPNAPLHDGAVVIEGERIAAAGALLPLTADENLPQDYGTRHRAAIGMCEETDAIIIVVSEENKSIGVALDGSLRANLSPETLAELLRASLGGHARNGG